MNNAHIESKAVTSDQSGVHALVRRFAACCLIGVAAMSAAQAGPRDRDRDGPSQRDNNRGERMQRQEQRPDERQQRQYDQGRYESQARADEQRRHQQYQQEQQNAQNDAGRRSGRLTPDERRDLRRQINEAGAELYPARPRR